MPCPERARQWSRRLGATWRRPAAVSPVQETALASPSIGSVESQDALARMQPAFRRTLARELDAQALAARLCPVQFDDDTTAVFAVHEEARGDAVMECLRWLQRRGWRWHACPIWVLPAALLLALVRGQIDAGALSRRRGVLSDPRQSGLMALFRQMIEWAVQHQASDIHINVARWRPTSSVRFTIAGQYVTPDLYQSLSSAMLLDMLSVAWMDVHGGSDAVFDPTREQQASLWYAAGEVALTLRWASLATDAGPSVCLRLLRLDAGEAVPDLQALGYLPDQIAALSQARLVQGGAIVFAGVVGAGKSTSLASLIRGLPSTRKVVTLEDPVEYAMPNALQNTLGRRLDGDDQGVFAMKLRALKRSAMNDLMIGEIRDPETGRAFMDLAGSGMSLYTTVHAGAAAWIPQRLASDFIGVSWDLLCTPGILKLLVYQCLLPRLCPQCALPLASLRAGGRDRDGVWRPGEQWALWLRGLAAAYETEAEVVAERLRVRNLAGCRHCRQAGLAQMNGLAGRTVAAEWIAPAAVPGFLAALRQRQWDLVLQSWRATRRHGLAQAGSVGKTVGECALYKAWQGWVDPRDIEAACGACWLPAPGAS